MLETNEAPLFPREVSVLIIDHNDQMLEMLTTLFELCGHKVTAVKSGQESLNIRPAAKFEVIYICSELFDTPPTQLIGKLKALSSFSSASFVAVTGYYDMTHRTALMAAGFEYFIMKPAQISELYAPLMDAANN